MVARVAWVTNVAPPYRVPVWEELGRHCELEVLLLEAPPNRRRVATHRDVDWWRSITGENFSVRLLPTWKVSGREGGYYTLRQGRALRGYERVVCPGWESPAAWQILGETRLRGRRSVGFYESHIGSSRYTSGPVYQARALFFRSLDAVVVPGRAAGRSVLRMGVRKDRLFEGFNAVDVASFARSPEGAVCDPSRVIYVGQLIERKNVERLVRAVGVVKSDCRLTIAGEGPLEGQLRTLVAELGLEERVEFLGFVPYKELPGVLSRHSHLVLPSTEEVWGLVVNEGLAAGMHVVVSEACGVAPSVAAMRGVYVCGLSEESIASALSCSLGEWSGPINSPEIFAHTPERLAEIFVDALQL